MLDPNQDSQASALLWQHWESGTRLEEIPAAFRPSTRAEGYAIQALLESRSAAPRFGWKIAATSLAGQKHINVDGPLAGRLLAEKVRENGAEMSLATSNMCVAEVEFAFRFGRDLAPRLAEYTVEEALAAVATLHPAIEIPDSRFNDFCKVGAAQLIADNACANLFILGEATTADWRTVDLAAYEVDAEIVGKSAHRGIGSNVLGDPRVALTWIVNELSALGITMHAGEVVTTGTCLVPIAVQPGDEVRADFGAFGKVSAKFC
jgi:2-keto-4-pentenoate hydratase